MAESIRISPKWWNFAKSDHTAWQRLKGEKYFVEVVFLSRKISHRNFSELSKWNWLLVAVKWWWTATYEKRQLIVDNGRSGRYRLIRRQPLASFQSLSNGVSANLSVLSLLFEKWKEAFISIQLQNRKRHLHNWCKAWEIVIRFVTFK